MIYVTDINAGLDKAMSEAPDGSTIEALYQKGSLMPMKRVAELLSKCGNDVQYHFREMNNRDGIVMFVGMMMAKYPDCKIEISGLAGRNEDMSDVVDDVRTISEALFVEQSDSKLVIQDAVDEPKSSESDADASDERDMGGDSEDFESTMENEVVALDSQGDVDEPEFSEDVDLNTGIQDGNESEVDDAATDYDYDFEELEVSSDDAEKILDDYGIDDPNLRAYYKAAPIEPKEAGIENLSEMLLVVSSRIESAHMKGWTKQQFLKAIDEGIRPYIEQYYDKFEEVYLEQHPEDDFLPDEDEI